MRGLDDYTATVDLGQDENLITVSDMDGTTVSNALILSGGAMRAAKASTVGQSRVAAVPDGESLYVQLQAASAPEATAAASPEASPTPLDPANVTPFLASRKSTPDPFDKGRSFGSESGSD